MHNTSRQVREAIAAIALCHNVTPVVDDSDTITYLIILCRMIYFDVNRYQASSPDEVALVKFTESVGLVLAERTMHTITLRNPTGAKEEYDVLNIFPFTSETKRMGIIVRDKATNVITFYMKGADTVMAKIVVSNDWLEEECGMAWSLY